MATKKRLPAKKRVQAAVNSLLDQNNSRTFDEITDHKDLPVVTPVPTYMSRSGVHVQLRDQVPECQQCFDEEGSYNCIRPAHPMFKHPTVLPVAAQKLLVAQDLMSSDAKAALPPAYQRDVKYDDPGRQVKFDPRMHEERVAFHIKSVAGRVLTIMDATITTEAQNKAIKTLIKKEFREQLNRVFKEVHKPLGEGQSESSEDEEARKLDLN